MIERIQVKHFRKNIIEATILAEHARGETPFVSIIPLI
jgi:hypothetical protein